MSQAQTSRWRAMAAGGPLGRILVASLVNSVGTGIYIGSAVFYFTTFQRLSANVVASAMAAGAVLALVTTAPSALIAERIGAQRFLVRIHLVRAVGYCAVAFTGNAWTFAAVTVSMVVFDRAAPPLMQSIIADLFPREQRSRVLGLRQSMTITGISAGTSLAALGTAAGSAVVFQALLAVNAVSFVCAALIVRKLPVADDLRPRTKPGPFSSWRDWPDRRYLGMTACSAVLMFIDPLITIGMPLWVVRHTRAPEAMVGITIFVYTASAAVMQGAIGRRITDLAAGRRWLAGGLAALLVSCCLFAAATAVSEPFAIACLLLAPIVHALGGSSQSLSLWYASMELADERRQERYLAVYSLSGTIQRALAPLAVVWMVAQAPRAGWLAAGLVFAVATAVCLSLLKTTEPSAPLPIPSAAGTAR